MGVGELSKKPNNLPADCLEGYIVRWANTKQGKEIRSMKAGSDHGERQWFLERIRKPFLFH